ncbi:probable RNA-directed DNA polymerase from transposon X-element [Trichonephila clavipes]|uniref:Probable RNA-directed DNA polymerase from transposon X-element n=1 Tax=Trichonephila clavipes TaxID=2585209 RepID=A0A8X7BK40_TRICX|nr:probable RNA-directed DNA polymerase from transposon X-element [Trichonephila clavipes]
MEKLATTNAFAALNTAEDDAEDVSPPQYKIKPIFMKIFNAYNLILQELHRSYPTATNTHTRGYIKIEAQSADDHRNITNYLKEKQLEHYVIEPPSTRPLKLVIKGLPDNIDPVDIKNDLVAKGINIVKIAQLRKFITKTPLPIYMIEIERDDHVNDIYQVRSCLYMQIKLDPFRKGNRITQCYNCNFFHHASQNCNMKTRCLKCGANHRTGACEIKERIENPLCINCNNRGHMASSTECPQFPKPKKGKSKSPVENLKRNINNNPVKTGKTYAQILNPEKAQQMAAPGNASSASKNTENNKNENINLEALNATQSDSNEFGFLQAILEMQKIFSLFPSLLIRFSGSPFIPGTLTENDRTHPAPGRGGTAILIKNCISHYHVPTPPQITGVEATLIMLTPMDHEPIIIGSTYIPPSYQNFRNLGAALDPIFNINNITILVGDFNAKHTSWGCPPPTPTRFGIASATIIDYALIKNLNWPCNIDSISELSSDHNPIKLHFPKTANFELPPPQLNTNWNVFTKTLASTENLYLPQANSTAEIESQVRELSSEILNAHVKASRPMTHSEPPYVQGELKHLFRERNKARKLWQFTRFPQHKTDLNRLQNKIKRLVGKYRQQVWEDHLTSLDAEDGSLWGTARAFRKKASPISALNGPNGIALSDSNKTDLIAQSLESQFQLNNIQNPQKDQIISSIVDAYINDHTNTTDDIQPALPSEIINYIKKIKIKKSPGRDGITNKMIKNLPLITVFKITNIINNMFKLRSFPNAWKTAVIIPILKPGKNPKLAESYRPISLLPILSKLAEKIISTRLNAFLENENILVPEQHGFRPRLSTSHQQLRVVEYIKDAFDRNQHVAAVFLDIQKAFDRVWHTGLLFKLITYKIPPPLILLLKSYISDRSFTVRINRTFSQTRPAKAGIAQGSILGPVLFNLYVNDIIKTTNTMICMYADDTAILSRHYDPNTLTQNINVHLAHLEIWFSVWKIAINTSKTEAISFSQKRPPPKSRSKTKGYPGLYTPNILVSLLIKTSRSDNILHTLEINLKMLRVIFIPLLAKSLN